MTGEHSSDGMEKTKAWVDSKGAKYAYAYFDGSAFPSAVGLPGYPHALLVAPGGDLVWAGHPSGLNEALIERHLEGAIQKPIFEWDKAVSKVVDALRAKELGKALVEARKLAEKGVADGDLALATTERMVESAVRSVETAYEAGNFLDAQDSAERWVRQLKGLDSAERLAEVIERCKSDPEAKRVIGGQKKLRALLEKKLRKQREADSLIERIEVLVTEFEGTYVAIEGERAIADVKARRAELR